MGHGLLPQEAAQAETRQSRKLAAAEQARSEQLEAVLRDMRRQHGEVPDAALPPVDQVGSRVQTQQPTKLSAVHRMVCKIIAIELRAIVPTMPCTGGS